MTGDRFHQLMLNSPDVVLHAAAGHVSWVSPSVVHLLGGEIEGWVGLPIRQLVHPERSWLLFINWGTIGSR